MPSLRRRLIFAYSPFSFHLFINISIIRSSFPLISLIFSSNPLIRDSTALSRSFCADRSISILVNLSSSLSRRSANFLKTQPKIPIITASTVSRKWREFVDHCIMRASTRRTDNALGL